MWLGVTAWVFCGCGWSQQWASAGIPQQHLQQYSDLAVTWMQEYLRIDTTNPPGNEMRAVEFYKKILDQEGIENRAFEYTAGRGDVWARIPANTHVSQQQGDVGHPRPIAEPHGRGDQRCVALESASVQRGD
jgi:hypothetical protein